jgi:hypothetical protein
MVNDELDDDLAAPDGDGSNIKQKLTDKAAAARPWLDWALLNLRVWYPFFRTPNMKARQVKYRSSDARSGMSWRVGLPQQCYACGATEGLSREKFTQQVRVFEAPTTILGGTIGGAALFLFFGLVFFWFSFLILGVATLVLGSVFQFIKSWTERVTVTMWSCPEHLEEWTPPEIVVYDEDLYVYLPSESLSEAARAELIASRKKDQKLRPPLPSAPEPTEPRERVPAADTADTPTPSRSIPVREELPPLKLAGEEED